MLRIASPKPRLDVRDLELVLAVAASGSTARASSVLHVTQSAVSRGLLLAEGKLGLRLFDRTAQGLSPTPAGERIIQGAAPLLAQLVALEQEAARPAPEALRLRVACECYTAYRWLPSALKALQRTTPTLDVSLAPEHSRAPVAALDAGEIDVALLTTSAAPAPLREAALFSDEVVFVMAPTHPLAARATITKGELAAHTLITSSQTPEAEREWFFRRAFGRAKPTLATIQFPLTEAIVDASRAGLGIAILSEWIAGPYLDSGDLTMKRLSTGPLLRPWRMAYRREVTSAALRLHAALERAAPRVYPPRP